MESSEQALEYFKTGMNCAQSALSALGPVLGLDRETCVKMAAPFGAGMARAQKTCGAVTGALMALGLARGAGSEEREARERLYGLTQEFLREFAARHGHLECRRLLGIDLSTEEGRAEMKQRGHYDICAPYVRDAVSLIERLIRE